jgi:hypothetical protein
MAKVAQPLEVRTFTVLYVKLATTISYRNPAGVIEAPA